MSDMTLAPARGKSRLKQRSDVATECGSPTYSLDSSGGSTDAKISPIMLPQVFEKDKHFKRCWDLTLGVLPFAVAGEASSVIDNPLRVYGFRVGPANAPYRPRTVYRATVRKFSPYLPTYQPSPHSKSVKIPPFLMTVPSYEVDYRLTFDDYMKSH